MIPILGGPEDTEGWQGQKTFLKSHISLVVQLVLESSACSCNHKISSIKATGAERFWGEARGPLTCKSLTLRKHAKRLRKAQQLASEGQHKNQP